MSVVPYLHVIDGRMRIKIPEVKHAPLKAVELQDALQRMDGIINVTANPTTGNVLIFFASDVINQEQIFETIKRHNCLQGKPGKQETAITATPPFSDEFGEKLVKIVVESVVELALKRLIVALV